ncbi:MAG: hypothetical protein WCF10_06600, partial [Polyangiales bacterium]
MSRITAGVEQSLTDIVGADRIRTDIVERTCNSIDIGDMPPAIKSMMPAGIAGAVLRPRTEEDLQALVVLA